MTDLYHTTKVATFAKEWRKTGKNKTAAANALKNLSAKDRTVADRFIAQKAIADKEHQDSVKMLGAAVDDLVKAEGKAP